MYTDLKLEKPKECSKVLIGMDDKPMNPKLAIYKKGKFWDINDIEIELYPTHWKYIKENTTKLIWQARDEMSYPTNALQRLRETFAFTSRDCSEDKMIAFMYGIVMGWDDKSYVELKSKHNWSDEDIKLQKMWHKNYNKAWNLFMEHCS